MPVYNVPHSWQVLSMSVGLRASMQQKMGFSRSFSQHGRLEVGERVAVGEEVVSVGVAVGDTVGEAVGQALPRLV